ncbi:MAG: lipase maturation factor family protein [Chloroflexota bacterium]
MDAEGWRFRTPIPSYILTRWLFLRLLGLIYLIAFASLLPQITGLIGANGILPIANYLTAVHANYGTDAYRLLPTLAWLNSSDTFLQFLCLGGILASISVIAGLLTAPALALCWIFYLSLTVAGQVFLGYQWDALLLEVGFLAIFFAPLQILPRLYKQTEPPRLILWAFRLLLFRLMFGSGVVKLASGDPNWANLTALTYHYYTQPLPTPLAWYAYQLPLWFQQVSVLIMFIVELCAPFLIFARRRRIRFIGAGAIVLLQILILLTGNYTFFNWLTIALCILLLDDDFLRYWLPKRLINSLKVEPKALPRWRRIIIAPIAVLIFFLGGLQIAGLFLSPRLLPGINVLSFTSPFRLVNHYGLFAIMTTTRLEIVVEGSNDGQHWQAYTFAYKPGDLNRPPPWIAPLQPRLDWQMWFAALGSAGQNPWFSSFMQRLLEGSPDVLSLLESNPFPDAPPRYIRAESFWYTFTDAATRSKTSAWWSSRPAAEYFPVSSLSG